MTPELRKAFDAQGAASKAFSDLVSKLPAQYGCAGCTLDLTTPLMLRPAVIPAAKKAEAVKPEKTKAEVKGK